MNTETGAATIETEAEFLAHAYALETESLERYEELADSMEVHNNPQSAELFRKLCEFSREHAGEVADQASGHRLPVIAPWDFKWTCPGGPESACMEEAHYLMDAREALELALHNEIRGRDFYAQVASESGNPEVRELAAAFAEEETAHVELLRKWMNELPVAAAVLKEDLDPPNVPE